MGGLSVQAITLLRFWGYTTRSVSGDGFRLWQQMENSELERLGE